MTNAHDLDRAALALLRKLGEEGCFAIADQIDETRLSLLRSNSRATLGAGHARLCDGEALVSGDLARWSADARPRLTISPAGRAHLRRSAGAEAPFAAQHRDMTETAVGGEIRLVNAAESPLAWLFRRKDRDGRPLIGAEAFAAGERLRADLTLSGALPRVTSNWTAAVAQGGRAAADRMNASEASLAARQRADRALVAVGPEFSGLLVDICGFLKGLAEVERERGWPPRSGKILLNLALGRLAAHYGLAAAAQGPQRARARNWRAEGARPLELWPDAS